MPKFIRELFPAVLQKHSRQLNGSKNAGNLLVPIFEKVQTLLIVHEIAVMLDRCRFLILAPRWGAASQAGKRRTDAD